MCIRDRYITALPGVLVIVFTVNHARTGIAAFFPKLLHAFQDFIVISNQPAPHSSTFLHTIHLFLPFFYLQSAIHLLLPFFHIQSAFSMLASPAFSHLSSPVLPYRYVGLSLSMFLVLPMSA